MKALAFLAFLALLIVGCIAHYFWNHAVPVQIGTFSLAEGDARVAPANQRGTGFGATGQGAPGKPQFKVKRSSYEADHWHLSAEIDGEEREVLIPVSMVPEGASAITIAFQVLKNGKVNVIAPAGEE